MSKIHLLTEDVCNRIAAGEVVDRPSSVVKELMENALDAGSRKISVTIEKAGEKLISVLDNGEGMDADDAMLSLESHATSKIRKEEDIFAITSFGFRGEALPSIASVSRFQIRTKRKDAQEGTEVTVNGGVMLGTKPIGCAPGTEVTVRDLFYNIPARRKFMRSAATEERHILECVTNISLANPDVAFELKLDGRITISSPAASDLMPRIRDLFGKNCADSFLSVSHSEYGIHVEGFVSKRSYTRNSRNDQRTYVNGRCVEAQAIYRGIREGYGPMLERGRYPVAVLFLTLPPGEVDVNVHPAKREVRFRHEFDVAAAVRIAVAETLRLADPVLGPKAVVHPDEKTDPSFSSKRTLYPDFIPSGSGGTDDWNVPTIREILRSATVEYMPMAARIFPARPQPFASGPDGAPGKINPDVKQSEEGEMVPCPEFPPGQLFPHEPTKEQDDEFHLEREEVRSSANAVSADLKILGIIENSYLVGSIPGGLILIDQHAAHERILFEQILNGIDGVFCQKLLLPITVELSRADMQYVTRNLDDFAKIGYEIEVFGQNTVKLNGIPAAVKQNNAGGVFQDILSRLSDEGTVQRNMLDRIARAACKAAVKAHAVLTPEECESLVNNLSKCELPFSCPHGRPTILNIPVSEIERRFGRK